MCVYLEGEYIFWPQARAEGELESRKYDTRLQTTLTANSFVFFKTRCYVNVFDSGFQDNVLMTTINDWRMPI